MAWAALLVAALAPALAFARPAADTPAPQQQPTSAPARQLAAILRELDATYARRDEPGQLAAQQELVARAEKVAPDAYDVLWRAARLYFWLADDPALPRDQRSRLGKKAWQYGDRATAADPGRVEGWHYAAAGVGNYALGIGVFSALRQGIEGKFKERLSRAERIDPDFQGGAIQTAWGRFWYELPWPKYDAKRSRSSLEAALRKNPDNVRAHVYVAELDLKESRRDQAWAELQKAIAHAPGRYDAPEERRWQEVARRLIEEMRSPEVQGSQGG